MLLAWKIKRKYKIENYVVIHMPAEIASHVWYVTEKSGGKHERYVGNGKCYRLHNG